MKKLILAIIALAFAFAVSSCGERSKKGCDHKVIAAKQEKPHSNPHPHARKSDCLGSLEGAGKS